MKVYVLCPAAYVTGGPEALHQFAHKAVELGFDARIVYAPASHPDPVATPFVKYAVPRASRVDDSPDSVVVVPEVDGPHLLAYGFATRVLWWLSVDNFVARERRAAQESPGRPTVWSLLYDPAWGITHLAQSVYASQHLAARSCRSDLATDYLHGDLLQRLADADVGEDGREDLVVYNPAKGMEVTSQLMARAPHLDWRPLAGLDAQGVADLLGRAKVYVDFGAHPGRDRIPREAASAGACVIVGRRGSAGNDVDVPVPDVYKIHHDPWLVDRTVALISEVMTDYASHRQRFQGYRQWIQDQEAIFTDEVFHLLARIEAGCA